MEPLSEFDCTFWDGGSFEEHQLRELCSVCFTHGTRCSLCSYLLPRLELLAVEAVEEEGEEEV